MYQPLEEGWSWYGRGPSGFRGPAPLGSRLLTRPLFSGRSAALSTADVALVPLPRQGSCRMALNHLLKLDFSIYHWLFVTRTRSASRCPEQLQREDGSRCSAALATVLDLYGLSWFCSFTVASRLRNHSSSKQQRRQQQAHVRATGCV